MALPSRSVSSGGAGQPAEKRDALNISGRADDQHRAGGFLLHSGDERLADGEVWAQAITFALFINLILAPSICLPFGPLDGKKIFDGDRRVWALIGLPVILIALPIYLGIYKNRLLAILHGELESQILCVSVSLSMKTRLKSGGYQHHSSVYLLQCEPHYWPPDPAR